MVNSNEQPNRQSQISFSVTSINAYRYLKNGVTLLSRIDDVTTSIHDNNKQSRKKNLNDQSDISIPAILFQEKKNKNNHETTPIKKNIWKGWY